MEVSCHIWDELLVPILNVFILLCTYCLYWFSSAICLVMKKIHCPLILHSLGQYSIFVVSILAIFWTSVSKPKLKYCTVIFLKFFTFMKSIKCWRTIQDWCHLRYLWFFPMKRPWNWKFEKELKKNHM